MVARAQYDDTWHLVLWAADLFFSFSCPLSSILDYLRQCVWLVVKDCLPICSQLNLENVTHGRALPSCSAIAPAFGRAVELDGPHVLSLPHGLSISGGEERLASWNKILMGMLAGWVGLKADHLCWFLHPEHLLYYYNTNFRHPCFSLTAFHSTFTLLDKTGGLKLDSSVWDFIHSGIGKSAIVRMPEGCAIAKPPFL